MLANQRALDISANNIANANTDGFRPSRAVFSDPAASGVQASVAPSTSVALSTRGAEGRVLQSGTDLAKETVDSMIYRRGFEMSAQVVKTADELLGTLIDIKA